MIAEKKIAEEQIPQPTRRVAIGSRSYLFEPEPIVKGTISVGILISTYNWPQALYTLLQSVLMQSRLPDEILIADDGSGLETKGLIDNFRTTTPIPIKHIWHEDKGFRKSLILNKTMKQATTDYIIQVDGDIMLHPMFIQDHLNHAEEHLFIQGSRAMIDLNTTASILGQKPPKFNFLSNGIKNRFNAIRFPLLSRLIKANPESSSNIKACNISFWRKHYAGINGYDNDFHGWGWEDAEFAARLINSGIKKKRLKLAAVCYHLHHSYYSRYHIVENELKYNDTIATKRKICQNGYGQV